MGVLHQESEDLLGMSNKQPNSKGVGLREQKPDDLEGRSKRNNLGLFGLERRENETSEECEGRLKLLIAGKLVQPGDVEFNRVHRSEFQAGLSCRCTLLLLFLQGYGDR